MKNNLALRNVIDLLLSLLMLVGIVWLAYHFTYTFPLLLIPAVVLGAWCCFNAGAIAGTAVWIKNLAFTSADRRNFINHSNKTSTLALIITFFTALGALYCYLKAIDRFDNKELLLYGKKTPAVIYDYNRRKRHRYVKYYYQLGDRKYTGECESKQRHIGDTILVIYSTHIPEIHRPVYPSSRY